MGVIDWEEFVSRKIEWCALTLSLLWTVVLPLDHVLHNIKACLFTVCSIELKIVYMIMVEACPFTVCSIELKVDYMIMVED